MNTKNRPLYANLRLYRTIAFRTSQTLDHIPGSIDAIVLAATNYYWACDTGYVSLIRFEDDPKWHKLLSIIASH